MLPWVVSPLRSIAILLLCATSAALSRGQPAAEYSLPPHEQYGPHVRKEFGSWGAPARPCDSPAGIHLRPFRKGSWYHASFATPTAGSADEPHRAAESPPAARSAGRGRRFILR